MIISGSVGGIKIFGPEEMTGELLKEALIRSEGKREIAVTEELLKKGAVLAVWNKKRADYVRTWVNGGVLNIWNRQKRVYVQTAVPGRRNTVLGIIKSEGNKEEILDEMLARRRIPGFILKMVFPEASHGEWIESKGEKYYDPLYYAPKPDKYGLPWGKIENHDHTESERINTLFQSKKIKELLKNGAEFGDTEIHYADLRMLYELLEETGYSALRIRKDKYGNTMHLPDTDPPMPVSDSLFERLTHLYQYDRNNQNDRTVDHEIFFYWVKEVVGELNKEGAQGETEPPEILPLLSITPRNFYQKHAHGIMILLDKLIKQCGKTEYCDTLMHLQRTFTASEMLRRDPAITIPNLSSDAEIWAEVSKNFRPLKN